MWWHRDRTCSSAVCLLAATLAAACGGSDGATSDHGADASAGGSGATAGSGAMGGSNATGGFAGTGGSMATGGAGGTAGTGGTSTDSGSDAPPTDGSTDSGSGTVILFEQAGAVFTPTASQPMKAIGFGVPGSIYASVRIDLDVLVGDYQPEIADPGNPDRTEHILFGLFRDKQPQSYQRYLMGSAAVTFATKAPHFRMFGRSSIAQGYTSYTSWSSTYAWQKGKLYHLRCVLDGTSHQQSCELTLAGAIEKALSGAVGYLDPVSHLSSGFVLELGTPSPGDIEASPIGWQFQNLEITATLLQ